MNKKSIIVSVIVPCRNEIKHISDFLDNVLNQDLDENEFEIIVADGLSDDGTRSVLLSYSKNDSRIHVIDNPEGTVSHGLNRAISAAQGEIIARMDVHTEYAPDYLKKCVKLLKAMKVDNVGGPARTKSKSYIQAANCIAYHSWFSVGGAHFHNPDYEGFVDTVTYGCWWRADLISIGLFDEELVRNQDDELNLRIVRNGGKIWQSPTIRSWYYPRANLHSLFMQYMQYGYWKVRVIQKHHIPSAIRHIVPAGFILTLSASALTAPFLILSKLIFLGLSGLYVTANLFTSLAICSRIKKLKFFPILPIVFACYHFGYGIGFLLGIWTFIICGKVRYRALERITR